MQKFRLEETEIEYVGSFVFLGSAVSESGGSEEDVGSRNKRASGVFVQLYRVWRYLNISKEVKIRIFNTNIKPVLLYDCETWKTTHQITRVLRVFVNKFLRRKMNIEWTDNITNQELWRITRQKSIENRMKKEMELDWTGLETNYVKKQEQ